jgi:hypothetical protein
MIVSPDCTTSIKVAVTAAQASFASSMVAKELWMFVSSTNCWIKQANPTATITCVAKASLVDTDFMTINDGINAAVNYEFDTAGNGVTGGRVQVNVSTDTTAAQVAARLKTAIVANQSYITVVDNLDGTLSLSSTSRNITVTETVTNAGFLVTFGPQASAASGSMYVPANTPIIIDPRVGSDLSVIRDSADGSASLTRLLTF